MADNTILPAEEIDERFVDVDFQDDPNYVFGDLGVPFCAAFNPYEAAEELLSDAEITACMEYQAAHPGTSLEYLIRRAYDQKNEGSCVGNMAVQGAEEVGVKQLGKDRFPELSAISCYKQIGRSAQSGAMVSDAMVALSDTGILPLDTPANRAVYGAHVMPPTGFSTPFPVGWKETAIKFRGVEFLVIRTVQGLFTALCKGHPVGVGREGHSVLYQRVMMLNGRRVVKYINSWGAWGDSGGTLAAGFGYDTESQIKKSAGWAFAIRSVTVPN